MTNVKNGDIIVVEQNNTPVSIKKPRLPKVVTQSGSIDNLIQIALTTAAPIESLEKLLAMKEKLDAKASKEAFDQAMANFQSECPTIEKTKKVFEKGSDTKIRYQYAPIDSIVNQTKQYISKYGLSYTIKITNDDRVLTATCIVTHSAGHSEESSFVVPLGTEQFMSDPQKYAARSTFAKRYAFCNAFGIMTGDEDKDDVQVDQQKEKFVNYGDKLKMALLKVAQYRGIKVTNDTALGTLNEFTGFNLSEMPKEQSLMKECYEALINLPTN